MRGRGMGKRHERERERRNMRRRKRKPSEILWFRADQYQHAGYNTYLHKYIHVPGAYEYWEA